jgi:hypothetical protein
MSEISELRKQIRLHEWRAEFGLYSLERRACREKADELKAKLAEMERSVGEGK